MKTHIPLVLLLAALPLAAQNTAVYPDAVPDLDDLLVAANFAESRLASSISSSATTVTLVDGTDFHDPAGVRASILRIDEELIKYCDREGNTITVCTGGRGFDGTTAASHLSHAAVRDVPAAWHHNQLAAEIVAITTALGPNLENAGGSISVEESDGSPSISPVESLHVDQTTGLTATDSGSGVATIAIGTVPDANVAPTLSRDSESPAAGDVTGSLSAGYQVTDDSHGHTGSTISALDAGDITTGTLADALLPSEVPLTDESNTFTATQTFNSGTTSAAVVALGMADLTTAGQRDSHVLQWRGASFDTEAHQTDWWEHVNIFSDAGASAFTWRWRRDGGLAAAAASLDESGVFDAVGGFEVNGAALNFSHLAGTASDAQIPGLETLSVGLTGTHVPFVSSGVLAGDADLTFDGDKLTLGTGATKGLWFGDGDSGITEQSDDILDLRTSGALRVSVSASVFDVQVPVRGPDGSASAPGLAFRLDVDNGLFRVGANNWGLAAGGVSLAELGGSQTLLVQDQTATTGDTTLVAKAGAAEAGNVFEVQSNAGSAVFGVNEAGVIATSLTASRCVETDASGNLTVAADVCGSGGGGGAPTDAQYWVSAADGTLSAEVVVDSLSALETAISATNIIIAADIDTSSELAGILGDETGSGAAVFGTSPTLTTPTIGDFTNATHDHTSNAEGGALNLANLGGTLGTGQAASTFLLESDIGTGLAVSTGTLSFAPSEVGTATFGSGSALTWTWDASAGTDCTFAPGNDTLTWTCGAFSIAGDLAVTGSITAGGSGAALEITEQTAPGAGPSAGVHNVYIDSTNSRWSTHENGGSVVTYLASQDQNAGTDVTADLEEETHASEHAENAADELLVENLGTACTNGQVVASDGSGGLDCAAAGGGSSYIELFYWLSGVAVNNGYSTTNFAPGIWTNSLALATGAHMQVGAAQVQDADAEIAYFRGGRLATEKVTDTNLSHVNFEAEVSIQTSTLTDTVSFFLGVACVSPGDATNTAFASLTYTSLTAMSGTSTGAPGQLFILSSTDQDITTPCDVGDIPIYKVEADETSPGMDNTINFMTFRVWTD